MITKYFTKVYVRFNPFGKEAKNARLFLSSIPPLQRTTNTQVSHEIISGSSTGSPLLRVTFRDKTEMELDPSKLSFKEVSNYFDGHSRKLQIKDVTENQ
ncbi:HBL346Cp [Eremothecium sinecaudum]|uniref:Large ribosomal subunit protein mL53 n=1 Tax=Eremothecium sinecaudum TaxID=45286 RepID=A0A120K0Q6_9SACH|nr:HBL346Cp [Eremothecium sinecaudum]AMD18556.1 HBL346Cp [Eremothecium sinecaudum]